MSAPHRPRLADWVMPRIHVVDGHETLVLHDTRSQRVLRMEPHHWDVLACADGTRDFDAILLAVARKGAYRRASEIRALFDQLSDALLLQDGIDAQHPPHVPPPETPADRPIEALPDYSLRCDGRGTCCGQYPSITFTKEESIRARAFVPSVTRGTHDRDHLFLPVVGSVDATNHAVSLVDGRCSYLADDGACRIHASAGPEAKPLACLMYPATFIDDGVSIRVSIAIECACVLASVGVRDGRALVPQGAATRGALEEGTVVGVLPANVPLTTARVAPREALAAWSKGLFHRETQDVPGTLLALAEAIDRTGLDEEASARAFEKPAAVAPLKQFFGKLADATALSAESADAWRSSRDRLRVHRRRIADAASRLAREGAVHPPHTQDEAFHLRATLFGHHALLGGLPLADALRERALRILVARAFERSENEHPLAIVEATLRAS